MIRCWICHKPTNSHIHEPIAFCHTCWINRKEDIDNTLRIINGKTSLPERANKLKTDEEFIAWFHEYDDILRESLDIDKDYGLFNTIFSETFEPISRSLWKHVNSTGWPFLMRLLEEFSSSGNSIIDYSPIINIIGRMVISSRCRYGVNSIPIDALIFLSTFHDSDDIEWEESFTFGWGVDHSDLDFLQIIQGIIKHGSAIWASGALEHAFIANQHKASEILDQLIRNDELETGAKYYLLTSLTFNEDHPYEIIPRYWDWVEELNYRFTWDPTIVNTLRVLISSEFPEVITKLPKNWTFQDLDFDPFSPW